MALGSGLESVSKEYIDRRTATGLSSRFLPIAPPESRIQISPPLPEYESAVFYSSSAITLIHVLWFIVLVMVTDSNGCVQTKNGTGWFN